jgi:hypothetical protein
MEDEIMTTASFYNFSESRPWHLDALPALLFVLTAALLLMLLGNPEASAEQTAAFTAAEPETMTDPSLDSQRQALAIISGE